MNELVWNRSVVFLFPILLTGGLWLWLRPVRLHGGGTLLSLIWNLPAALLCNWLGLHLGWWSFSAEGGVFVGVPVDLWLVDLMLWGAIPMLVLPRSPLPVALAAACGADAFLRIASAPFVVVGPRWWMGALAGLVLCALPAQLLGRWTLAGHHLYGRATLQVAFVSGLVWLLVTMVLDYSRASWLDVLQNQIWYDLLVMPLLAVSVGLGYASVHEFVLRGRGGTPVPWDPPRRLVQTGPYAFMGNPMHVSLLLLFGGLALWLRNPWIALLSFWTWLHGHLFLIWDGPAELSARHGSEAVRLYKRNVPGWWPRWRPWYLEPSCISIGVGSSVQLRLARWLFERGPVGLERTATLRPEAVTYRHGDSTVEMAGLMAVTQIMGHLSLPWAWTGWIVRLPVIRHAFELLLGRPAAGRAQAHSLHRPPTLLI